MRAAVLRRGAIVVDDIPELPPPGPGEILVETVAAGICGSDLHVRRHVQEFVDVNRAIGNDGQLFDPDRDVVLRDELAFRVLATGTRSHAFQGRRPRCRLSHGGRRPGRAENRRYSNEIQAASENEWSSTRVQPCRCRKV